MSLTLNKIDKALVECNRFIEAAIRAKKRNEDGVKENGAMKRASLDLTRALADLRK